MGEPPDTEAHAQLTLLVITWPCAAPFFARIGFPGFLACPVFPVERMGGLALVPGTA